MPIRFVLPLVAVCVLAASGAGAQERSLGDRRGISAYEKDIYPGQVQAIQKAAGYDVPVEVRWAAIAMPGQGAQYGDPDYWTNVYFVPLSRALTQVGSDDAGRDAMREKLKRIVVTFDDKTAPASAYENGLGFADGVLTVNFRPFTNSSEVDARAKAIQKFLEDKL